MDGKSKSNCKIRKRACSSSSSSSLVRRYRLKRAILVGKKTGSSTPVPTWKIGRRSPPLVVNAAVSGEIANAKGGSLSVRKLGATLWEINEVPSHSVKKNAAMDDKIGRRLSHSGSLLPPTNSPLPERIDQSEGGRHRRRASSASQKLQIIDYIAAGGGGGQDYDSTASVMETEAPDRTSKKHGGGGGRVSDTKLRLKDLGNSLTTSKELLKVLYRVGGFSKHHHPSSVSIMSALKAELDRGCFQVEELIHEQRSYESEIEFLARGFAEEKAVWREKERDRVRNAIGHVAEELEVEKKLRRQTERLNKKLGKELADTKAALSNVVKELECEKRAKDILEQVCDELARGIGEDRAQVEELKRESAKVIEEVEKEREMLQLADVLREERVQMKLSEAKYHFEEKNAAVERLRSELESYLQSKLPLGEENSFPNFEKIEELYDDGSGESDLQSIELNMDNATRSYKWSYEKGVEEEEGIGPRRSLSEKIQWGSISLKKGPTNSEPGSNGSENLNGFDRERLLEFVSQAHTKNNIPTTAKDIKDHHKAAGFGGGSLHPVASPIRKWGQNFPLSDPFREDHEKENSLITLPVNDPKIEVAGANHGEYIILGTK